MPRKPQQPRKSSDPEQSKRFIETVKELGPAETGEAFDRAFKSIARRKPQDQRRSD